MTPSRAAGRRRRSLLGVVAVLGVLLLGYAGVQLVDARGRHFEAAGAVPQADTPPPAPASTGASPSPPTTPTPAAPAPDVLEDQSFTPSRILISRPAVDAPIQPVDVLPDGNLVIPEDVRTVGWWRSGAAPGSPVGTVVLAGHVDSATAGPGALFHLDQAPVGSRIILSGRGLDDSSAAAATQAYEVVGRRRYAKAALPAATLFAQGRTPRLVVITCGGEFDPVTRHYTDNVVVFAEPVG